MTVLKAYEALVASGELRPDPEQAAAAASLTAAIGGGFDDAVSESRDGRQLVARVLRCLRSRPEYRCFLPDRKRRAA